MGHTKKSASEQKTEASPLNSQAIPASVDAEKPFLGCATGTVIINCDPEELLEPLNEEWSVLKAE